MSNERIFLPIAIGGAMAATLLTSCERGPNGPEQGSIISGNDLRTEQQPSLPHVPEQPTKPTKEEMNGILEAQKMECSTLIQSIEPVNLESYDDHSGNKINFRSGYQDFGETKAWVIQLDYSYNKYCVVQANGQFMLYNSSGELITTKYSGNYFNFIPTIVYIENQRSKEQTLEDKLQAIRQTDQRDFVATTEKKPISTLVSDQTLSRKNPNPGININENPRYSFERTTFRGNDACLVKIDNNAFYYVIAILDSEHTVVGYDLYYSDGEPIGRETGSPTLEEVMQSLADNHKALQRARRSKLSILNLQKPQKSQQ
jgi:hypothetical protein